MESQGEEKRFGPDGPGASDRFSIVIHGHRVFGCTINEVTLGQKGWLIVNYRKETSAWLDLFFTKLLSRI